MPHGRPEREPEQPEREPEQPHQPRSFQPGEGWRVGDDGVPYRHAARVLLLDADDRLLLVRAHDADQVERTWWFTVGGGIDPGETPEVAAVREVAEETGLVIDAGALVGPVASRWALFDFFARSVRQHEVFFVHRLPVTGTAAEELSTAGWTAVERSFVDELGWWSLEQLREIDGEVFPARLPELLAHVLENLPRAVGDTDRPGAGTVRTAGVWAPEVWDLTESGPARR